MDHSNRLSLTDCALWCLILTIALLPVGLGGNRPFPLGLAQFGLALGFIAFCLDSAAVAKVHFFMRLRWSIALMAAVLLWAVFQMQAVWLPDGWAHPLWQESATVLGRPIQGMIALSPESGFTGLARLITYLATGLLAYGVGQSPQAAKRFLTAFWGIGCLVCLYGLTVYVYGSEKILWFDKTDYIGDLTATFVSRNHFAVYAGMVFLTGFALLVQSWREQVTMLPRHKLIAAIKAWLEQKLLHLVLLMAVMLTIVLSHSRAGLVFSLAGVGSFLFLFQIYLRSWWQAVLTGILMILLVALTILTASYLSERFAYLLVDSSSLSRIGVWQLVLRALHDNPWLGYGLNGFSAVFRLYQPGIHVEFNHAHSDWLESLLEFGLPMGAALWLSIFLLMSGLWHGITHRRKDGYLSALGLAASILVLGHAAVDFSLQIPGVAMSWAALVGLGLAQSWGQKEKQTVPLAGREDD